jgi:hypothetical protein
MTWSQLLRGPAKGRKNSAVVTALAIATAGSADGESNQTNEPDEDRIKIGIRRLQAISNVLSYSTSKSYDTLQMHLVWAGSYAMSSLSDDVLGSSFIWPNSLPPEQALADQATLIARDAAAHSHRDLITKGVTVKPMMYEELLTASQHKQLTDKVCTCFEDEELHLTDCHQ